MGGLIARLGGFMAFAGVASFALSFFNYELRILAWMDQVGDGTMGNYIRAGLVVGGIVLFVVGSMLSPDEEGED